MPVTTSSQSLLASLPTFMSVFGDGRSTKDDRKEGIATNNGTSRSTAPQTGRSSHNIPLPSYIFRRKSSSTFQSESADSSPTTTISTIDSSLTEPSPSSSPESPDSLLPLSTLRLLKTLSPPLKHAAMDDENPPPSPLPNLPGANGVNSPNKKMRNAKNLALGFVPQYKHNPQHALSAPATPGFTMPPKPPKRKPSNLGLTITTADANATNQLGQDAPSLVPQTPLGAHSKLLQQFGPPSEETLFSPGMAPEGGMQLPPLGNSSTTGRFPQARPPLSLTQHLSYDSAVSSPIILQTLDHVPEEQGNYELPPSREEKSDPYLEGPVCIYEPYVYLYLEPLHTEASKFDVIINVAREVLNPFTKAGREAQAAKEAKKYQGKDAAVQVDLTPGVKSLFPQTSTSEPASAVSDKSFRSAFESLPEISANAPSVEQETARVTPEYIHIPWDHNTDVLDDLLRLCELIDSRVQRGKRVLIHCQCGVSRSATLVVAYGLYKNPHLQVQEAYDAVKERSEWIGPNMNLIYQLADFRAQLLQPASFRSSAWRSKRAFGPLRANTDSLLTPNSRSSLPSPSSGESQRHPLTAPLQEELESETQRSSSLSPPMSAQMAIFLTNSKVSPGPSSAPPNMQWSPTGPSPDMREQSISPPSLDSPHRETSSSIPEADRTMAALSSMSLPPSAHSAGVSHQPEQSPVASSQPLPGGFSSMSIRRPVLRPLPLRQEAPRFISTQMARMNVDHVMTDHVPETPSLLSPRALEFTASPFHRTAAGDLAGSSVFEQGLMSPRIQESDPRSPHQVGEAPITRSIDDLLD